MSALALGACGDDTATPKNDTATGADATTTTAADTSVTTSEEDTAVATEVAPDTAVEDTTVATEVEEDVGPTCDPEAPQCDGSGPNSGCTTGQFCNASCVCENDPPPAARLLRPSRSSAVDIAADDSVVAMVNSDDGSVSFFRNLGDAAPAVAKVATSLVTPQSEPHTVAIHPGGKVAFVANRATGTVARITGIDTATPSLAQEAELCAECMGVALTPSGDTLLVSDWVNGVVLFVKTSDLTVTRTVATGRNPYAIAVTNDGDDDDSDEKALVTDFYGRPEGKEMEDDGRKGVVHVLPLNGSAAKEITLAPLAACFTGDIGGSDVTTACFPNQLHGVTIHTAFGKTRAFVVSTAASPKGPINFKHNVQALVSVIDVDAESEETALTANLNQLIKTQQIDTDNDDNVGRRFLNSPVAIAFVNNPAVAFGYVASAASDVVLRVVWSEDGAVSVGSPTNFNIPVGQNPQGIVTRNKKGPDAFVANLISRDLSVLSFGNQNVAKTVVSTTQPTDANTDAFKIWKGKRFFNTSTGIWSKEGWGSCQGCHFLGLSDSVTWAFGAGPRSTLSMDGQYASDDSGDMRALNWTAIFDETHDFENNVRGTSGGKGAILKADGTPVASPAGAPAPFAQITAEDGTTVENHQALNGSMKHLIHTAEICSNTSTCPDWDLVDRYVQTIRSPRGKSNSVGDAENGAALFEDGGCGKCHGGAKWTISSTFYDPEVFTGTLAAGRKFEVQRAFETNKDASKLQTLPDGVNLDATLVAGNDGSGTAALRRQACNLREVGTFAATGGAAETRDNGTEAQGAKGFNPPSLLGLALSAPYFHNGAAKTLVEVFDARFVDHTTAGNPNFVLSAADKDDLAAFLLSIDEGTPLAEVPPDAQLCPLDFTP